MESHNGGHNAKPEYSREEHAATLEALAALDAKEKEIRERFGPELEEYKQMSSILDATKEELRWLTLARAQKEADLQRTLAPVLAEKEKIIEKDAKLHSRAQAEANSDEVRRTIEEVMPRIQMLASEVQGMVSEFDEKNKQRAESVGYNALDAVRDLEKLAHRSRLIPSDGAHARGLVLLARAAHDDLGRLAASELSQNRYGK